MPQELKSFLLWVSVIVVAAFMVPFIELVVGMVRRNQQRSSTSEATTVKAAKRLSREVA